MKMRLLDAEAVLEDYRELAEPLPDEPEYEPPPEPDDIEEYDDYVEEDVLEEFINRYGYPDMHSPSDPPNMNPVCSQCRSYKQWNRGEGTLCDACMHQDEVESRHDDHY